MTIQSAETAFRPSEHGFRFANSFTAESIAEGMGADTALLFGDRWGLCGGMCWAALDRYYSSEPRPEETQPPGEGDPIFVELISRQIESFQPPNYRTISKCIAWQGRPDEQGNDPRTSVGYLTQVEEWPSIKSKLDRGLPATLCLVRERNIARPDNNHIVVAYAFSITLDELVVIQVYDPNYPENDNVIIKFRLGQENSRLDAKQDPGPNPRGFFLIPYDRAERHISPYSAVEADTGWLTAVFG